MPESNKQRSVEETYKQLFGSYPKGYKPPKEEKPQTATQVLENKRAQNTLSLATNPTYSDSLMYDRLHPGGVSIFDKKKSAQSDDYQKKLKELLNFQEQLAAKTKAYNQTDNGGYVAATDAKGKEVYLPKYDEPTVNRLKTEAVKYERELTVLDKAGKLGIKPPEVRKRVTDGAAFVESLWNAMPRKEKTPEDIQAIQKALLDKYGLTMEEIKAMKEK